MKIEQWKFYRSRGGGRVGPMTPHMSDSWRIDVAGDLPNRGDLWREDGLRYYPESRGDTDLVAEWVDELASPVRTVTRKEIVPGEYGKVRVLGTHSNGRAVGIRLIADPTGGNIADMEALDLRAAAVTLTTLADALDEGVTSDRG